MYILIHWVVCVYVFLFSVVNYTYYILHFCIFQFPFEIFLISGAWQVHAYNRSARVAQTEGNESWKPAWVTLGDLHTHTHTPAKMKMLIMNL